MGQGENSPCCLHALGLGQGTAKPPQAVPCPVSFLKRQLATARMEHPGRTTNPHKPHCWGCQRPPQTCLQDTSAPPRSPVPNPHHGNGPEDEGQLGQCRSQTRLSKQGGVGLDPGEQLLLDLSGTEQDWGPTACRDRPSPAPYRGERKLLYLFCVGKSCFFTAPITGSHQPQGCAGKINTALFLSITKSLHKTGLGFFHPLVLFCPPKHVQVIPPKTQPGHLQGSVTRAEPVAAESTWRLGWEQHVRIQRASPNISFLPG